MTTLVWFRQDLRLADNPALSAATEDDAPVIPIYLHAPNEDGEWAPGGAMRWWLHHTLASLESDLAKLDSRLCIRRCEDSLEELRKLIRTTHATRIVWNRRYEPAIIERDRKIKATLRDEGVSVDTYNAALLHEPWTVKTKADAPFQVFTPFWRHVKSLSDPAEPLPAPTKLRAPTRRPASVSLHQLKLLPTINWTAGMEQTWQAGSAAAHARLVDFSKDAFDDYPAGRDRPGVVGTSRMSPYLHLGAIGPREIWHAVSRLSRGHGTHSSWRDSTYLTEVGWREFAHHLLYHFPHTPLQPLRDKYKKFPWKKNAAATRAWQRGRTGFPMVDAGMRELWHTGWMHNRVRMIVASFLIKDLLVHWLDGARWFWDTLVDADLASNTLGWQWVAGCGADASPFFRIFNPITQGEKFDPEGLYIKRWVPELAKLPSDFIQQPWAAPADVLAAANIVLGRTYPHRIVDHDEARRAALAARAVIKN